MYLNKFKKSIKAKKIPQSHNVPFQTMYSTKALTMGKGPSFKTTERADQRKDYYQSLERNKENQKKFAEKTANAKS